MWSISYNKLRVFVSRRYRMLLRTTSARTRVFIYVLIVILLWYVRFRYAGVSYKMEGPFYSMGVQVKNREFVLNGKPLWIMSGAMHYFRVVPEYWRDRMLKMKAGGLNTLETYVSWNLHEPLPGQFDFDGILNLRKYIELAQEVGLYVIFRPGPFICSEWDFGGMPSWLLKDPDMKVRTNYKPYQEAVVRFFNKLLPMVEDLQLSRGGPIIMVQVENEFGSYSSEIPHLQFITDLLHKYGIQELLVTSDNEKGMKTAPFSHVALPTANFKKFDSDVVQYISGLNPDFPFMVMEYWSGWFDHWGMGHNVETIEFHAETITEIFRNKGSINFYMYHGGTNFGFMAGANFFDAYKADITSYDYDAPISEAGDITPKYVKTREIILDYVLKPQGITSLPEPPENLPKAEYGDLVIESYLSWNDILNHVKKTVKSENAVTMEMVELEETGYGQSYGYIVYQKTIQRGNKLRLTTMNDRAQILINSKEKGIIKPNSESLEVDINNNKDTNTVLDIVVENLGRVNYIYAGSNILNEQRKGVSGDVYLDDFTLTDWKIYCLDFNKDFIKRVSSSDKWKKYNNLQSESTSGLYRTTLNIQSTPQDTFLKMENWNKGIVIINGFNLGRYWNIGPQKTLYVPAPILKTGNNEVLIFEQHQSYNVISFKSHHDLGPIKHTPTVIQL